MSIFGKTQYIWLASHFREELYRTTHREDKENLILYIKSLAKNLKSENPNAFDEELFYENVFYHNNSTQTEDQYNNWHKTKQD